MHGTPRTVALLGVFLDAEAGLRMLLSDLQGPDGQFLQAIGPAAQGPGCAGTRHLPLTELRNPGTIPVDYGIDTSREGVDTRTVRIAQPSYGRGGGASEANPERAGIAVPIQDEGLHQVP